MQRVGIMGGSFNPIHIGHLMLAKEAYQQFHLDYVLVMPNKHPVYKDASQLLSDDKRAQMIKLAIQNDSYLVYSDLELKRSGNTYTVDTLYELHKEHPDTEYYFILGGDSLAYLDKWYQYEHILEQAVILCARRGENDYAQLLAIRDQLVEKNPEARIEFLKTDFVPISSSELRVRIAQNKDVSEWIPEQVLSYILKNHLYM